MVMLRAVLAVLFSLGPAFTPGVAAEAADGQPAASTAGPPVSGQNFTLPDPGLTMIWIPPGTFRMSGTLGAGDDTVVTLTRGYWLGRTEVTQAQWQALIESAAVFQYVSVPSFHKGSERPVERVSWEMAMAYCADLSAQERAAGRLPPGYEYTLPTEAQWEYACRAGTTGKYAGEIAALAWYEGNSGGETHPVAQKQPNAWGLYDMHGNVQEWCADWYGAYPGGRVDDPSGPISGIYRVMRGGSWNSSEGGCRSALRTYWLGSFSSISLGFRVALAPQTYRPPTENRASLAP